MDRAGQLWALLGGVALGLAANAAVGAIVDSTTLLVIGAAGFLIGIYPAIASITGWPLPGRISRKAAVAQRAYELSGEILSWLGDRRRDDPISNVYGRGTSDWDAQQRMMQSYSNDTMARWNERYLVRALAIFDELVGVGVKPTSGFGRWNIEHATNPLGMGMVGTELGTMAAAARRSPLRQSR